MKTYILLPIIVLAGCIASGCVSHTTVKDEARQTVHFSSPEAAQTFYDAYLWADSPKGRGAVRVYLQVPSPYWHRTVTTDNVRFNTVIKSVDGDGNGIISDEEARDYASKIEKQFADLRSDKSSKDH